MARRQLHKLLKRHVGCCPCWSFSLLVALVGIGNRSNSQIIGSIENLGALPVPENPDLFSVEPFSLILRLSARILHVTRHAKKKFACKRESWAGAKLANLHSSKLLPASCCMHCASSDST